MAMNLQERDHQILRMVYDHGGILHKSILKAEFWPNASSDAAKKRLTDILCLHHYLAHNEIVKAKDEANKDVVIYDGDIEHPEAKDYYWLGWRGAIWIAQDKGHAIDMPETCSKEQQEVLKRQLASLNITWRPNPIWKRILHDRNIIGVHLAIAQAIKDSPNLKMSEWIHEDFFRLHAMQQNHYPDAYFFITDSQDHPGLKARFLLEIDRTNHDLTTLVDKLTAGVAFLRSAEFAAISSAKAGRYLIVLDSQERMRHLIEKVRTELAEDAYVFLFSTFGEVTKSNPVLAPIWLAGDSGQPQLMLKERGKIV